MRATAAIFRRELRAYFATPIAYVFIVIFVALSGAFTFYLGDFFERGEADLQPFFDFHPWLFLVLIPAIGMRLWAEERKSGTIELLMTLPVTTGQAVLGKFLAAWCFATVALALTVPMWITVALLGAPDHGVILGGYLASWLLAGTFLAVTECLSAVTKNQVIAFIFGVTACFLCLMSGLDLVLGAFRGWAPAFIVDLVAALSAMTYFREIVDGVIDLRGLVFLVSLGGLALFACVLLVNMRKAA